MHMYNGFSKGWRNNSYIRHVNQIICVHECLRFKQSLNSSVSRDVHAVNAGLYNMTNSVIN